MKDVGEGGVLREVVVLLRIWAPDARSADGISRAHALQAICRSSKHGAGRGVGAGCAVTCDNVEEARASVQMVTTASRSIRVVASVQAGPAAAAAQERGPHSDGQRPVRRERVCGVPALVVSSDQKVRVQVEIMGLIVTRTG